ncbi:MAG: phosphorylase [Dongiales bacterium]
MSGGAPGFILAVSGLAREAGIARGPGVRALAAGGPRLPQLIEAAIADGAAGILSFGIAGGLDPKLPPGTAILAGAAIAGGERWTADAAWRERLAARLPKARIGDLAGVDLPVMTQADKQVLAAATGALAVDMESHIAARLAAAHGLAFAALRVICDPAARAIPPAAIAGMQEDGGTDLGAILVALLRGPGQLPAMIRLAGDARTAFGVLARCRRSLDPHLMGP